MEQSITTTELELDSDLLAMASELDGLEVSMPAGSPVPTETTTSGEAPQADAAGIEHDDIKEVVSFLVDGYEGFMQVVGHPDYCIAPERKTLAINVYSGVLNKHKSYTPAFIVKYKEEAFALGLTFIAIVMTRREIAQLRLKDVEDETKKEAQSGEKS